MACREEHKRRCEPKEEEKSQKRIKSGYLLRTLSIEEFGRTNDEIHSSIRYCPVMRAMMDTKQMQRLKDLNQLGTASSVYMNANHKRFEHSMGVAYLAVRLCERLIKRQPQLGITEKDVLCVKLAGLCHDLGHGPFSHVYDGEFQVQLARYLESHPEQRVFYKNLPEVKKNWKHEEASLMMIDAALFDLGLAIDMDDLDAPLKQIGDGVDAKSMRVYPQCENPNEKIDMKSILTSRDWVFIKECILGNPILKRERLEPNESGFVGRPLRDQEFLYDIISNRHTGLDVDKIDYYARDLRRTQRDAGEIELRMIEEAVVAWGRCSKPHKCFRCDSARPGKHLMICYPEKMVEHAVAFFNKRFDLHSKIYHHKTSLAATIMVCDIFKLADPHFQIPTRLDDDSAQHEEGETVPPFLPISRAMLHKVSYLRLRDTVMDQIMGTTTDNLKQARLLILKLWNRNLYKCAAMKKIDFSNAIDKTLWEKNEQQLETEILQLDGKHDNGHGEMIALESGDVIVKKSKYHHGAGDENPISLMRFLPKTALTSLWKPVDELPEAMPDDPDKHKSHMKRAWMERTISFYCPGPPEKVELLRHVFDRWNSELKDGNQMTVFEADEESYGSEANYDDPVPLTQDSETMTPVKDGRDYYSDPSPIPTGTGRNARHDMQNSQPVQFPQLK